jgi:hypothetical protein
MRTLLAVLSVSRMRLKNKSSSSQFQRIYAKITEAHDRRRSFYNAEYGYPK